MSIKTNTTLVVLALILVSGMGKIKAAERFHITGWDVYHPQVQTIKNPTAHFQEKAEAGFTHAGIVPVEYLDAVEAAGMKAIVQDQRISRNWNSFNRDEAQKKFEELHNEVKKHPAAAGYFVQDEPVSGYFPGISQMCEIIRETAPGKEPYVNLLPNYAVPEVLGCASYQEYLERYISICKPSTIGYDFYGIYENDWDNLRPGYWENLAMIREFSLRNKIPFRFILLSVGHFKHRIPSETDINFQAFSALCYGAKQLEYFTYCSPEVGNYRGAPLDQSGEKTPTWYAVRNVNQRIHNLAGVLNHLISKCVYHLPTEEGQKEIPPGSMIMSIPNGKFVVGEFTHEESGKHFVMILNKSLTDSVNLNGLVWRNKPQNIRMISPWVAGKSYDFNAGEHKWLAPGHAVLLKIE